MDSGFNYNYISPAPGGVNSSAGTPFYESTFHPYNYVALMNAAFTNSGGPLTVGSGYGQPNRYQLGRTIRLGLKFTF